MDAQETYEIQHERYSRRVYPIFLAGLQKQLAPAIAYIRANPTLTPPLDALINPDVMREPINEAYQMVATTAAKREYYGLRAQKGFIDFLIEKWRLIFFEYSNNYAYLIDNELAETTKQEIRTALSEAYEQGLSGNQIAAYIYKKVGRQISRSRAQLIARTESATAANLGKQEGAKSWLNGEKGYKQWLGRVANERSSHLHLNNTIVDINGTFTMDVIKDGAVIGTEECNLPGDVTLSAGNRCNCRCSVRYLDERMYQRIIKQ